MSVLVCGSLAFDRIMVFKGRFKDAILPDQLHMLSVSFLLSDMRQGYGGCAGNVAYNLNQLGVEALPMGTAGHDFESYKAWFKRHGIVCDRIHLLEDQYTACAFIITDMDDNQITAFHPGAMSCCHQIDVGATDGIRYGLILPEGREGMIKHAMQLSEAGIPFLFDPGQGTAMLNAEEMELFIDRADWLACNDYEFKVVQQRLGLSRHDLCRRLRAIVVTRGAQGAVIYADNTSYTIPAVKPEAVRDPTGCGDSHRAGLLYGLMHGLDWQTTGRLASLVGAIKVACHGTQNHSFTMDEIERRFVDCFAYTL